MRKWMVVLFVALGLFYSSTLLADECMEGDCDNGFGTGFTLDNRIYEGEWQDGMPHGQGKKYMSKGKIIEGRWEKGKLVQEETVEKKESRTKETSAKEN